MQSLVSHLHKNPTYELYVVWHCEFGSHQDRAITMRFTAIYRPTCRVLTVYTDMFLFEIWFLCFCRWVTLQMS